MRRKTRHNSEYPCYFFLRGSREIDRSRWLIIRGGRSLRRGWCLSRREAGEGRRRRRHRGGGAFIRSSVKSREPVRELARRPAY